ncbi:type II toxin-antitoxin system HicA family toxin [Paenibacillus sp. FSL K6-1558]|uniref:type II toxin-antitoxin system HicA family toxin n=1 Tax=Paenibacillus sp. FSL K6-1558 TaxID=2921473 RepID=UPI004046D008
MIYSSRGIITLIEVDGWYLVRVKGSHHHFKHHIKRGLVTVPHPKRELKAKTTKRILEQAGL